MISGTLRIPGDLLAPGHGNSRVVEELVRDVDAGRDGGADREAAGMVKGAVADVLEQVVAFHEGRQADPVCALAAHLGEADQVTDALRVHPHDHGMAPDSGTYHGALWVRASSGYADNRSRSTPFAMALAYPRKPAEATGR